VGTLEKVKTIRHDAFRNSGLSGELNLVNLKTIDSQAFFGLTGITSVGALDNAETIGDGSFRGTSITSVGALEKVKTIGASAFLSTGLTGTLNLINVESIGKDAFNGRAGLTSVGTLETVETLGDTAFRNSGLTGALNLANVKSIGNSVFSGTCKIEAITSFPNTKITATGVFMDQYAIDLTNVANYANAPDDMNKQTPYAYIKSKDGSISKTITPNASYDTRDLYDVVTKTGTLYSELVAHKGDTYVSWARPNIANPTIKVANNGGVIQNASSTLDVSIPQTNNLVFSGATINSDTDPMVKEGLNYTLITKTLGSPSDVSGVTVTPDPAANPSTLTVEDEVVLTPAVQGTSPSQDVNWSVDDPTKVSIIPGADATAPITIKALAVSAAPVIVTATSAQDSNKTATYTITAINPVLASDITLDPSAAFDIQVGSSAKVTATVTPSNATNKAVNWSSSAGGVATVDTAGNVTAVSVGSATITATAADGSGVLKTVEVTVVPVTTPVTSVVSTSTYEALSVGDEVVLNVAAKPATADNTDLVWSVSGDSDVVSYDEASKKVTATGIGTAIIKIASAYDNNLYTEVTIEVFARVVDSVSLDSVSATLTVGDTKTLVATVLPAAASNKTLTWSSSANEVATVDQSGKVTTVSAGTAVVTAAAQDGSQEVAQATITVILPPLVFNDSADFDIPASVVGTAIVSKDVSGGVSGGAPGAKTYSQTGLPAGLAIDNSGIISGTPTAVQASGTATSTVSDSANQSANISIAFGEVTAETTTTTTTTTATPTTDTLDKSADNGATTISSFATTTKTVYVKKGKTIKIPYVAYGENGKSASVTWATNKVKVATITKGKAKGTLNAGLNKNLKLSIKALKVGKATITLKSANGKTIKIKVVVVKKDKKNKKLTVTYPKTLKVKASKVLKVKFTKKATNAVASFKSNKPSIVKVDAAGKLTAVKKGTAKITVKVGAKKKVVTIKVK
jgi:uncharacterized protein YjdB